MRTRASLSRFRKNDDRVPAQRSIQITGSGPVRLESSGECVKMSIGLHSALLFQHYLSMGSRTEIAPRRIPIQERGEQRVAGLLEAAAAIFAEVGYEAATMRNIAVRAGASIGSLYQFFPNKEVVARAIKIQYCQELKELWANLVAVSAKKPTLGVIDEFLKVTIKAIERNPAIIRLMDAPRSANPSPDIKESLREQLVALFLARKPRLSRNKAHRYAEITVQMIRAILWLYLENEPSEREALVSEMKSALVNYLTARLAQ
jgi:AcrR family transcriptional regulator